MDHEINELKKIVTEFVARLAYESQQFERKFNAQISLIIVAQEQKIKDHNSPKAITLNTVINKNDSPLTENIGKQQTVNDTNHSQIFIYPKDAAKLLGVGTTKFYALNKLPDFPKPRNPLGKRPMYLRSELENWAKNLICMNIKSIRNESSRN